MTFLEMKAETSRRLAEVGGRVFWSDDDIAVALNLGYAEMSDATEWFEQYVELDVLADRPYYDLWTLIGPAFLGLRPAFDEGANRWLIPSNAQILDAHDRRWERVVGSSQRVLLRGLRWLALFPRSASASGTWKQYYVALPPPLVLDTDVPGFPDTFHRGVVDFALTDLWAQDAETGFAMAAWSAYLEMEAGLTAWVEGRASGPLVRGFDSPMPAGGQR